MATKACIWPAAELGRFQSSRREDQSAHIPRGRKRSVLAPTLVILLRLTWLFLASCRKKQTGAAHEQRPDQSLVPSENGATSGTTAGALTPPAGFGKPAVDLDEMVKGRGIRALAIVNLLGFFYWEGKAEGIPYEALQEFEKFANQKLNAAKLPAKVVLLPTMPKNNPRFQQLVDEFVQSNVPAGCKMLRSITDTYFDRPGINPLSKTLFTFAGYNAGPDKIVRLRKKAQDDGLDPNKWFGNVELEVAQDVGGETVTYVGNTYKHYVACKSTVEQKQQKQATLASK